MTHYEQESREKCPEGCGKGFRRWQTLVSHRDIKEGSWIHYYGNPGSGEMFKCRADPESVFAERMAQEVEDWHKAFDGFLDGDIPCPASPGLILTGVLNLSKERDKLAKEVDRLKLVAGRCV